MTAEVVVELAHAELDIAARFVAGSTVEQLLRCGDEATVSRVCRLVASDASVYTLAARRARKLSNAARLAVTGASR